MCETCVTIISINCECLTIRDCWRLPPARDTVDVPKRRHIIYSDQISDLSADRLTKGRPKSFEDIGYRSIRCLICVETWTSTSSIIDNGSVIVDGSNDHETCHSSWPILISHQVFVLMSLEVLPNWDRRMDDEKYFHLWWFRLKCSETKANLWSKQTHIRSFPIFI